MTSVLVDLRHAVRVHLRTPGVTFIAAFTMALAIGATTAIFSVVHGVVLRPLPYPSPHRLMALWEVSSRGTQVRLADPNFNEFRDRNSTFSAVARYVARVAPVSGAGEPTRETVVAVSKDFFNLLGVQPSLGRSFGPGDAQISATPTVVVSHGYWARSLGSSPLLSALQLRIQNRVHQVVGVMPPGSEFPANADLWVPVELDPESRSRTAHNYNAIGRLRDDASEAQASADLSVIAKDIVSQSPEQGPYLLTDAAVVSLHTSVTGRVSSTLYILLAAVLFLLLVACANVANLLLARAAARRREIAIRNALGISTSRLIRQFVAEALVLVTVSGLAGLVIAFLGTRALLSLATANLPRANEVSISWPVLTFAAGLSAIVALALGLVTAASAARRDPRTTLGDTRGEVGTSSLRAGRAIVAAQMAITIVLLIGAVLLGRSLLSVLSVNPGFRTEGLVAMDFAMTFSPDPAVKARLSPFYSDVLNRIHGIPGVEDVAAASAVPMDGGLPDGSFAMIAPAEAPKTMDDLRALLKQKERLGAADYGAVSPTYFRALRIPLIGGRVFDDRDAPDAPHAAVINESLARAQWPGVDPIGRTIAFGNMDGDPRPLTIVGIVGDTREYGPEHPPRPTVYANLLQRPRFAATVVIEANTDPRGIIGAARDVLRDVAPDVPPRFRTFEQMYSAALGSRYFNLTLVAAFAGTALVLAVAGLYGVSAYNVTRRRREISVRLALGATPGDVRRMILRQGLITVIAGVAVGFLGALGLTRALESLLFGVAPTDPLTFAAVIAGLCAVAALACYLPARRATLASPIDGLRQD